MDDVVVMVLAIDVFLEGLPKDLVNEKLADLGMSPNELEKDLQRVRRIVPRPLRQVDAARARRPRWRRRIRFTTPDSTSRVRDAIQALRGPNQEYGA